MGRKLGELCRFWGSWIPVFWGSWIPMQHNVAWTEAYLRRWHLDLSSCLATTDIGRKLGGGYAPFLVGELGPYLAQYGLGRGLPPYQVAF